MIRAAAAGVLSFSSIRLRQSAHTVRHCLTGHWRLAKKDCRSRVFGRITARDVTRGCSETNESWAVVVRLVFGFFTDDLSLRSRLCDLIRSQRHGHPIARRILQPSADMMENGRRPSATMARYAGRRRGSLRVRSGFEEVRVCRFRWPLASEQLCSTERRRPVRRRVEADCNGRGDGIRSFSQAAAEQKIARSSRGLHRVPSFTIENSRAKALVPGCESTKSRSPQRFKDIGQ